MTLVIKGQEITANSLSGRRRVLGPAPNLHSTPCKTVIVIQSWPQRPSKKCHMYMRKCNKKKPKTKQNMGLCDRSESTQINRLKGS